MAIELPPPRKLAPRVPTPDPSKPFAAGGFQAFKRKWQAKQQEKPAVTVSTGAFAPPPPEASWPTLDGRPAPELPESRRAQESGYDPRTEPLLPGDWRCSLCGRPNIRRRDACASRRCRGRRPEGHTGEDAYQRALRESREADQRRQAAEDDELERALAASRAESQPQPYENNLNGPSSYGGGAFGSGGTNGFGGSPRAASPVLGGGLYGGAFSSDSGTGAFSAFAAPADGGFRGGAFGGPTNGAFAAAAPAAGAARVSVGARARARAAARQTTPEAAAAQQTTPEASRLLAAAAQPATVSPTASARALASQPPPSSTGWVALQDPASGRTYYEHAGRGLTTWEKPAELEDDDAELRAALAASAAQPPPVDEDAELRAALALSARERPPAPPAMDDDAELRAVLALSAREASQQPVQQDDDLARALAASLQETRRPAPTDISSVLAAAGLSRHLPLFRREEIESVEDLRYLSVDDFVAIGLERAEAQDLSRMCATVAV